MCMYCSIACASGPVSIVLRAMSIVGHCLTADAMPAFCASALIADGVMSGPATMYSCERLLLTVCRPCTPITMATTPNVMRTAAATNPPISSALRMSRLLSNRDPFRPSVGQCGTEGVRATAESGRGSSLAGLRVLPEYSVGLVLELREKKAVRLQVPVAEELVGHAALGVRRQLRSRGVI